MKLDILIFAAHPDDAELAMGGTIAKFSDLGYKIGIIDLTLGEMSTRGNKKLRAAETEAASKILKISLRDNLNIPDGDIQLNKINLNKVVSVIRKYEPKIIFVPYKNDRHPDHIHTSSLVKNAMFKSGLEKLKTKSNNSLQKAYRPKKLFYYMQTYTFEPSFIVDISQYFKTKMKSVVAYKSQFYNPKNKDSDTFISSRKFLDFIEARAKYFGFNIGVQYGEPFFCEEKIEYDFSTYLNK